MNLKNKFPLMLLASGCLLFTLSQHQATAMPPFPIATDTTCLVKTETAFDFPDSLRKKVNLLIEDKVAGGIDESGKTTWENSPDAPEYYQIVLRKNKITIKYKGTVCDDKMVWENIESCKAELKKLLNKQ